MELNDLKNKMSMLDEVLEMSARGLGLDLSKAGKARGKLLKKYRQGAWSTGVLCLLFVLLGLVGDFDRGVMPLYMQVFLAVYLALTSMWYLLLYNTLRRIDVAKLPPARLLSRVGSLRMLTLIGEVVIGVCAAVFLMMLLVNIYGGGGMVIIVGIAVISVGTLVSVAYLWPDYVRSFHDMTPDA